MSFGNGIAGAEGQCLYISGVPGTGKTATVRDVMRCLRRRAEAKEVLPFQFVELNSLQLPSPQHAYCQLYEVGQLDQRLMTATPFPIWPAARGASER